MQAKHRSSGIALPIFSLPGEFGIGSIGKGAKRFINFLSDAGFSYWRILPLGPTSFGDSPFQCFASKALNHYFIDIEDLLEKDLLKRRDIGVVDWGSDPRTIDYQRIYGNRVRILKAAYHRFKKGQGDYQRGYTSFLRKHEFIDYACFMVLKDLHNGKPWNQFSGSYQEYSTDLFRQIKHDYRDDVEFYEWTQYIFLHQWAQLKSYANTKGISIIGEMPMYISYDSIDVYKHHRNFLLNAAQGMDYVAGYPPDIFHSSGQVWGTPLYDYDYLKRNDYRFLRERLNFFLSLYDYVTLDHFRGYLENFMIPKGSTNGLDGLWMPVPEKDCIRKIATDLERVIAEDVDYRGGEMAKLLDSHHIKDMRVIEFGFPRDSSNINQPSNYSFSCFSYSSTHDCQPLRGYLDGLSAEERRQSVSQINTACRRFGVEEREPADTKGLVESLLELNLASLSTVAIQAMQDILFQGNESRINTPSTVGTNWRYRITDGDLSPERAKHLRELNRRYGRR